MARPYKCTRFHLSLSSFEGIVFGASHWFCRLHWENEKGEDQEADAEWGKEDERSGRFLTEAKARAAGLRLAKKLADGTYYIVTEGSNAYIDPQPVLSAPGNLKQRLNTIQAEFEAFDGWNAQKTDWPKLEEITKRWQTLMDGACK